MFWEVSKYLIILLSKNGAWLATCGDWIFILFLRRSVEYGSYFVVDFYSTTVLRMVVLPFRYHRRCRNKLLLSYCFAVNTSLSPQLGIGAHAENNVIWYPRSLNLGVKTGESCWMTLALLIEVKVRKVFGTALFSVSGINKWFFWILTLWIRLAGVPEMSWFQNW